MNFFKLVNTGIIKINFRNFGIPEKWLVYTNLMPGQEKEQLKGTHLVVNQYLVSDLQY